ncbi:MAG: cyclase family protein [Desulfopila sp.]
MLIDLSVEVTKFSNKAALENERMVSFGHLGTHFDVMDKEFSLEYVQRKAILFNVARGDKEEIDVEDIDISRVEAGMFVAFYSGYIEREEYGTAKYFREHPQLSNRLIQCLLDKEISMIGVDFAGIRRGKEHTPKDQYCADHNVFVVENLCNLKAIAGDEDYRYFRINVFPIKFSGMTGLPCRVVAEV